MLRRRAAVEVLGAAVRRLVTAHVSTMADVDALIAMAAELDAVSARLERERVALDEPFAVDDPMEGVRMYSPLTGRGNGTSPPLSVEVLQDGSVRGTCTLSRVFEGPPARAHGGVSAFVLDQMVGLATAALGQPGLTRSLTVGYLRPVPLEEPLVARAAVESVDGRKVRVAGTIARASDPEVVLSEARGLLVTVDPERAQVLFAGRSSEYGTFRLTPGRSA